MSNTRKWIHEWKEHGPPPMVPWKFVKTDALLDEELQNEVPTFLEFYEQHLNKEEIRRAFHTHDFKHYIKHAKVLWECSLNKITYSQVKALHRQIGNQNKYVANEVLLMIRFVFKSARSLGCLPKDYPNPADEVLSFTTEEICDFTS